MVDELGDVLPRPTARQVPRLAWTAARAWGPQWNRGWPAGCARAWAAFTTVVWWLPTLGSAHVGRRLSAIDESALAVITVVGERNLRRWTSLVAFVCPAVICWPAVLLAVAVTVPMLLGHPRVAVYTAWISFVPFIALIFLMILLFRASNLASGGRPGWLRRHRGQLMVSCLAAWPRQQGHAGRLVRSLGPVLAKDGRSVVAAARSPELAELYRRWVAECPGICLVLAQEAAGQSPRTPR